MQSFTYFFPDLLFMAVKWTLSLIWCDNNTITVLTWVNILLFYEQMKHLMLHSLLIICCLSDSRIFGGCAFHILSCIINSLVRLYLTLVNKKYLQNISYGEYNFLFCFYTLFICCCKSTSSWSLDQICFHCDQPDLILA